MKTKVKRFISVFLCVAMLVAAMCSTALAAPKTSGKCGANAKWSYNKKSRTLTISGKGTIKSVEWPEYYKVNVVIKKGITGIGAYAFYDMYITKLSLPNTLTSIGNVAFVGSLPSSITIPKKVTKIGTGAFAICDRLKSINVEKGNKKFVSVDGVLFNKDKTELIAYPAGKSKKYVIPKGTKTIGKRAFESDKLEELTIPSSVKEFKEGALCSSFKILRFEGSVPKRTQEELKNEAVCVNLKKVYYPKQLGDQWRDVEDNHRIWFVKNWSDEAKYSTSFISYVEKDKVTPAAALLIYGEPKEGENEQEERERYRRDIKNMTSVISTRSAKSNPILNSANSDNMEEKIKAAYLFTDKDSVCYFYATSHANYSVNKYGISGASYEAIATYLNMYTEGTVVVILDSCFSNQFSVTLANNVKLNDLMKRCVVLTACMTTQLSNTDKNGGFFTQSIKSALEWKNDRLVCDENGDGEVTMNDLHSYVKKEVEKKTEDLYIVHNDGTKEKLYQTPMQFGNGNTVVFKVS